MKIRCFSFVALSFVSHIACASSISLGYQDTQHTLSSINENVKVPIKGFTALIDLSLNDAWSLDVDYATASGSEHDSLRRELDNDRKSYGLSLNYQRQAWSYGISVGRSDDESVIKHNQTARTISKDFADADSIAVSVGYGIDDGNWFYGLSSSLQYSDWQSEQQLMPRQERPAIVSKSEGDSSIASLVVSVGHAWLSDQDKFTIVGAMLQWNHVLSSDEQSVEPSLSIRRQARVSAIRVDRARSANILDPFITDEDYGQFLIYMNFDLSSNWSLSLDYSTSFAIDDKQPAWSSAIEYRF